MHIEPAEPAFDADGTPYSPLYGDVYHSAESGPGQARHVFLGGNDLPRRWAGARVFGIVETGFGIGVSFLETWRAWRDDPERSQRLHFVSVEKHPFTRDALAHLHANYPELAPLARELRAAWPPLVGGLHRLHFESERVTLTLGFGDAAQLLPKLRLDADAIYLDGFAPQRNPDMWSPEIARALARLSHQGTTLATWSTAAPVRASLEAAGFVIEKRPGFGRKHAMLSGRFEPRWHMREKPAAPSHERHAIVVGAGLAGAAVCERLAARGWRIDLVDARSEAAIRGPHRFAGAFHPHVSSDDALRSRAVRNGLLYSISRWHALERAGHAPVWDRCGVIQLAADGEQEARMAEASAALAMPADYARYVTVEEAQALAGCRVRRGGWWFESSGWMRPTSLVRAQLEAAGDAVRTHFGRPVQAIEWIDERWRAVDAGGTAIAEAPVLVLANSADAGRLAPLGEALARVRGQVTYVPADRTVAPRTVVTGRGYVLPPADGVVIAGSTYERDDDDLRPQVHGHETNLAHLARLLPDATAALDPALLDGAVGFRCTAPDRMPLAGAIPDLDAARADLKRLEGSQLGGVPRRRGLYCATGFASRGLVWASLAAETLASRLEGEPLPLESDLADALDPARFVLRRLRRGRF